MPMGISQSPALFLHFKDYLLQQLPDEDRQNAKIYQDDFVKFSDNKD